MTDTARTILLVAYFICVSTREVYAYVKGRYNPYTLFRDKDSDHFLARLAEGFLLLLAVVGVEWKRYWLLVFVMLLTAMATMTTILDCLAYRKSRDKRILVKTLSLDLLVAGLVTVFLWVGQMRGLI